MHTPEREQLGDTGPFSEPEDQRGITTGNEGLPISVVNTLTVLTSPTLINIQNPDNLVLAASNAEREGGGPLKSLEMSLMHRGVLLAWGRLKRLKRNRGGAIY